MKRITAQISLCVFITIRCVRPTNNSANIILLCLIERQITSLISARSAILLLLISILKLLHKIYAYPKSFTEALLCPRFAQFSFSDIFKLHFPYIVS